MVFPHPVTSARETRGRIGLPALGAAFRREALFQNWCWGNWGDSFLTLAAIVGLGGGITNFVMDLTGLFPYGQMVVFLYPILITYGVFPRT